MSGLSGAISAWMSASVPAAGRVAPLVGGVELAARALERVEQRFLVGEVAEQRRQVRKGFVERGHVDVVGSVKYLRMPSTIACVVSCAMMSCDRHVKTV